MTGQKPRKQRRPRGSGALYQRHKPGCPRKRCECPWWIQYRGLDGKRYAETTGLSKKLEAEAALRAKVGDLDRGTAVTPETGKLTVREAFDAVLADYKNSGQKSIDEAERRLDRVARFFGALTRMAGINPTHLQKSVAWRQETGIVAISGPRKGQRVRDVSGADINRDLTLLRRAFNLAIEQELLLRCPKFPSLAESKPRTGFFEADQLASVLQHLPVHLRPVVTFAALTGWRKVEVTNLEWRNVTADEVRLDDSKNGTPRSFPITAEIRRIIDAQKAERDKAQKTGKIVPQVFFRALKNGKVLPVGDYKKAWRTAREKAGQPGRYVHDLRRTAVRALSRHRAGQALDGADRSQDEVDLRPLQHLQRGRPRRRPAAAGFPHAGHRHRHAVDRSRSFPTGATTTRCRPRIPLRASSRSPAAFTFQ